MKQTILDTLIMSLIILALGALSWWLHWDDTPIDYRIETPAPFRQARYVRV